jgi:hypothetical protein
MQRCVRPIHSACAVVHFLRDADAFRCAEREHIGRRACLFSLAMTLDLVAVLQHRGVTCQGGHFTCAGTRQALLCLALNL